MKTREEILKRIDEINDLLFMIDMVEHWQDEDRKNYQELTQEKLELAKELEKIENEN